MVLSLCAEKLNFGPDQLEEVAKRIREGDLTEVLKLYEEDMKHPVKSAISGTLVRTVLIQVQKTKVCSSLQTSSVIYSKLHAG